MLQVTLNNGRAISLEQVYINETYEGLLIKNPSQPWTRVNEWHFSDNPVATSKLWFKAPIVFLGIEHYRARLERELPKLRFVGRFASSTPTKDPQRMFSELVVVWHQDELHPILSPQNVDWLKQVDWENLASDFDIT